MLLIDSLAEEQIRAAIRRGELDDLDGMGQPLVLEDDAAVPEELRTAYRMLKNAGCLPPELVLRNEIQQLEGLLVQLDAGSEQASLRRRLCLLKARLAAQGRELSPLTDEIAYRAKLVQRLSGVKDSGQKDAAAASDRV